VLGNPWVVLVGMNLIVGFVVWLQLTTRPFREGGESRSEALRRHFSAPWTRFWCVAIVVFFKTPLLVDALLG
jgi:hypothetical protein